MGKPIAVSLLKKYLSGSCTAIETEQVNIWFDSMDGVPEHIVGLSEAERTLMEDRIFERILNHVEKEEQTSTVSPLAKKSIYSWKILTVAASLFLFLTLIVLWVQHPSSLSPDKITRSAQPAKIKPGGNKAVLTLGDGSSVVLAEANLGTLADQQDVRVIKTAEGQLSYKKGGANLSSEIAYNTITTPVGGKYSVVLPDGSKVWLNSKSSLRFPTSFTGPERKVQMTGEVYFEIVKNPKQPFKVLASGTQISVLGTHFNVMAYEDEAAQKTTLLEGSIHLTSGKFATLLKPGQQAGIAASGIQLNPHADLQEVMAWRNNLFVFKDMEIKEIARQISRWYDVQVVFKNTASKIPYTGTISKDVELSELLSMLQFTGLKYELNNRLLTIIE